MKEIYVGHEVVCKYKFIRHAYAHDLIGCHFKEEYFIRREYTILEKKENGEYVYLNTNDKGTILSYDDIRKNVDEIINCHNCDKAYKMDESDCTEIADTEERVIGVIEVQSIQSFIKSDNQDLCIQIINNYNDALMKQRAKTKIRKL